ncbi:MAG: DUF177 domain-containing protein [Bacteroidales bacterium]|nr:DUF177 domain-containing protein [Bacteroidales bacterium]
MSDLLLIPLDGFASGEQKFSWRVGKEFFGSFDNTEILDASIDADVSARKAADRILVDCSLRGEVTVECDRCLEDLQIPVDEEVRLKLVFAEESADEDDGREAVEVRSTDTAFDMAQTIYDYVCLSLPIQRFHKDGGCNPEVMDRISRGVTTKVGENEAGTEEPNPFAALQSLFNK